ncbi:MAG: EamA family transporter [Rhodospirillaceae bacterium]|nr:EamA family transporter [Rhodospirillaceae bacterium]
MFETWIFMTLAAVAIQSVRSVLQKNYVAKFTVVGVAYARFLFAFPLTVLFVALAVSHPGATLPAPTAMFLVYAVVGGVAQVFGNLVFTHLVGFANFTISTTYSKTETVIAALFSFLVIGDVLQGFGLVGVLLTFVGVIVIAAGRERLTFKSLALAITDKAALYGIGTGALFAVGSTSYRAAALALGTDDFLLNAFYTLAWVSFFQAVLMTVWVTVKSPTILFAIFRQWRSAVWLGLTGAGASAGWYAAFAVQKVPYVLAVGQVELVLAYCASRFMYKETAKPIEVAGILITVLGILFVVFAK